MNEHSTGCSPAVLEAIRAVSREDIARYEDPAASTRLAERWFGVDEGWLLLTNGLDDGLNAATQGMAAITRREPGAGRTAVVVVEPAFEMYALYAEGANLDVIRVMPPASLAFDLDAVVGALSPDVRVVYLTDPNNPTGLAIPPGAVATICEAAPQAIVLLDEAYGEYSGRTAIGPMLDRYRNLIVGRTFAKAYGLAGLRIGAIIGHPDTLAPAKRVLPPYGLNVCGARALEAAFRDRAYVDWSVAQARESKTLVYDFCRRHNVAFWESDANFVLMRVGPRARAIVGAMLERGFVLRDRTQVPGCDGCVRMTAGVVEHTRQALDALAICLKKTT
jgi:histidinol-phosphate aminotransferase